MDNYLNRVIGNRYEILEIIGVGGMAVVYKAYDRIDDRVVAVKILKDEYLANEEYRIRFKNESRAISMLNHPNIVKVYDVSFGDDIQYIVMEHVEGITLKEFIEKQKVLDWKEALIVVIQILKALQHAHDKGVIHRDIKPQNILLLPNATIKVTDFGIASFKRGGFGQLQESEAIGSVHYVSPEQAKGDYTDEKSDIYSVGVVLYEMLTGRIPFDSDSEENIALMQVQAQAVKPTALNPSIPVGLEQITLKAMQKDAADRYQSAAEFLVDLDEFRKNPDIVFDYQYFIDKNPTKYISPSNPLADDGSEDEYSDDDYSDEAEDDTEEVNSRSAILPVLIGVTVALLLVGVIVLVIVFGNLFGSSSNSDSDRNPVAVWFDNLFSKDSIEVPNFLNMDFEDVLEKYPELAIEDPPQYEYNSTYKEGRVCNQYPEAGKKVSKDTVFKLTVATNAEMVLIKDVAGYSSIEAEKILTESGFVVELIPVEDNTKAEGEVIKTDPSANKYFQYRGTVYIYYATSSNSANTVKVPDLKGWELEAAKQKIISSGLKVGAVREGPSSPELKGYVVGQSPTSSESVKEGVMVNLVIGNGIPETNIAEFKITLPDVSSTATCTVKTYLNDVLYETYPNISYADDYFLVMFTGSGSSNTFKIYCDSVMAYSGEIDFTTTPATISNVRNYQGSTKVAVPDVTAKTQSEAEAELSAAGFTRYKITYEASSTVAAGYVITQSPVYSDTAKYSTATIVTVVVSSGPSADESQTPEVSTEASELTSSSENNSEETTDTDVESDSQAESPAE